MTYTLLNVIQGIPVFATATSSVQACFCQVAILNDPATLSGALVGTFAAIASTIEQKLQASAAYVSNALNNNAILQSLGIVNGNSNSGVPLTNTTANVTVAQQTLLNISSIPVPITNAVGCTTYVQSYIVFTALIVLAAIVIVIVNAIMQAVLRYAVKFERHHTTTNAEISLLIRSFLLQFFNTGLLLVLVTAFVPGAPISSAGAKYSDFNVAWYMQQGPAITLVMCLQVILPHVRSVSVYLLWKCKRMISPYGGARSQGELNGYYRSPSFSITDRYASLLTTIYIALLYGTGIPIYEIFAILVVY